MTFEEWDGIIDDYGDGGADAKSRDWCSVIREHHTDWEAERRKLKKLLENSEVALEEYRIKRRHHIAEQGKLIGALREISDLILTKAQMRAIARFHLLEEQG